MKQQKRKDRRTLCIMTLLLLFAVCGGTLPHPSSSAVEHVAAVNNSAATASNRCNVRYANGFAISYQGDCKIVTVFEPGDSSGLEQMATFVLVPKGTDVPVSVVPARSTIIEVPVRRAILRSASHASFFSLLGLTDRIVGIVQGKYVNDPEVAGLIRSGKITEVGVGSGMTAQFDVERLFSLRPDLVLSNWTNNPAYAAHIKAQEAGLPVALISDYEENTPLGRAEWIKFIAAFFNAEAEAERIFDDIERRYLAMAAKARNVDDRPTVMYGTSYQGSWFIPGGKSCFANLVKDAGGRYVWGDNDGIGNRPVDAETAMIRGRNADCWFTHNQAHFSLASMAAEDSRYALFRSFRAGRVYGNNGKIGPGGGNDYYQGTATSPDLLLADMIAIIHPELLPDHELIWHLHLPPTLSGGTSADGARRK